MQQFSDKDLIKKLRSTMYAENDDAMNYLYEVMYGKVVRFILKNSGSKQRADDVFQDGVIILYKAAKANRLDVVENIQAYFFSICRNLWFKELKKEQRVTTLTDEYNERPEEALPLNLLMSNEKSVLINQLLNNLGEGCRKVLTYYYYERLKMKQIMERMNFSSEQVAKNKKSTCMKKLKEIILSNPRLRGLLK